MKPDKPMGEVVPWPRRKDQMDGPVEGPDEMVTYLIGKIADIQAGKITGFLFCADGPGGTFVSTQGEFSRGDTLWMAHNLAHRAIVGD